MKKFPSPPSHQPATPRAAVTIGEVCVRLSLCPEGGGRERGGGQGGGGCCGVTWPPTSRIPVPSAANNSGGAVYRSSLQWTRAAAAVASGCFGRDGRQSAASGSSSSDSQPLSQALDRLHRFRWTGAGAPQGQATSSAPRAPKRSNKKKARTSDKSEHLKQLTERLKAPSSSSSSTSIPPPPLPQQQNVPELPLPTPPTPPPLPPEDDVFELKKLPKPKSRTIVGSYIQRTIPFRSASFSQVDYSPADGKYIRSTSNTGLHTSGGRSSNVSPSSTTHHTLPKKKVLSDCSSPSSSSATVSPSSSTTVCSQTGVKVLLVGSSPSVDSAVGSEEWLFSPSTPLSSLDNTHTVQTQQKSQNSSRSLTHPLPARCASQDEDIPFRSIDGNGLKGLVVVSDRGCRPLEGVREESDTDSAAATSECDIEKCCVSVQTLADNDKRDTSIENNDPISEQSDHTIRENDQPQLDEEETLVRKDRIDVKVQTPSKEDEIEVGVSLKYSQVEDKESSVVEEETYVAKWPEDEKNCINSDDSVKHEDCLNSVCDECENKNNDSNKEKCVDDDVKIIHTEINQLKEVELPASVLVDDRKICNNIVKVKLGSSEKPQRWSDEGPPRDWSGICSPQEPQSPEDQGHRPTWPPGGPKWLTCQSSEERDDGSPQRRSFSLLARADSLSEGESDPSTTPGRDTASPSPSLFPPSDQSDCEGRPHTPRRYSKRPLRGPYGQMLEAEMKKPETSRKFSKLQKEELKFLEEYVQPNRLAAARSQDDCQLKLSYTTPDQTTVGHQALRTSPKRKVSANIPYSVPEPPASAPCDALPPVFHQRTTSSPSQLEGCSAKAGQPTPSPQLLAHLLKGSSERFSSANSNAHAPLPDVNHFLTPQHRKDLRTHVVLELFETERSYVESLQILVNKYLQPLKSPENAGLVEAALVDEIFYQVPAILQHHELFLEELRMRLEHWDTKQRVGDIFLETFTKQSVIDTYTAFINNWKTANEAIKTTSQAKPAFARFLEAMAREHKGKLALDSLLIMPVQRVPRYELLIQSLLKHTEVGHPDYCVLQDARKEVHTLAVRINCTERESLALEQLESVIEGAGPLSCSERTFVRNDLVTMVTSQGRKERMLFLFSDMLLITSIKRRSGTIRKPSATCPGSLASILEANKYKVLLKLSLDDLEIVKAKDENVRRLLKEMEHLLEDVQTVNQMSELMAGLHCAHAQLDEALRELSAGLGKQLAERQSADSQLSFLEIIFQSDSGVENISLVFSKPDIRSSWEESVNEAKQRLAAVSVVRRRPTAEFWMPVPIRKTRAGLQFTCAVPTLGGAHAQDVWVCNSDGYVGQVCVLSLHPEPTVTSCNGVCNARILCIAAVPGNAQPSPKQSNNDISSRMSGISISVEDTDNTDDNNTRLDSSSSSDGEGGADEGGCGGEGGGGGEEGEEAEPTMWLGTEDGSIHVYNCSDNIRIKKNKVKIQHRSAVHSIIYLDNRVFVSLANGDITVYSRDQGSSWNTNDPQTISVGTASTPVTRMVPINGRLWCSCHSTIKVLNTNSLQIEHCLTACGSLNSGGMGGGDGSRSVSCLAVSGLGVWISLHNSATLRLFHTVTFECLAEVNVASAVTKMLASCDDIIRQHKAACLRVTSLLACRDLLWVGTSAGVILTMPLPHVSSTATKVSTSLSVAGVPHGHTGHVRFLTVVEPPPNCQTSQSTKSDGVSGSSNSSKKLLVISGGDGYEDFRSASMSDAGREDSTNHLLLWQV
ncbi:rho guanine nucleotide exchange factor 17 isoform X2 [Nilaparvata lugens]|uniref:rho guanine nucleotide exchange factor 17 isoform X2 n=1 Tax=Nilaparvata lugens TaxID=108931 RepID=UPI00193CA3EB|nr:rho guanine nucleotide exchange factor 17 isoform X2 [Nilaparvata lugens]